MKMMLIAVCLLMPYTAHTKSFSISTKDFSGIQRYISQHDAGENVTIDVITEKSISQHVQDAAVFLNSLTLQNVLLKGATTIFGATALSYSFIAYFIYRVYQLVAKINSWLSWNTEAHHHNMIEEAKMYLHRTLDEQTSIKRTRSQDPYYICLQEIKREEKLLRLYVQLNTFLKKYRLRALFAYDPEKEQHIEHVLQVINEANNLCTI